METPARFLVRSVALARLTECDERVEHWLDSSAIAEPGDESLHDLRVALRRLRTWMKAFRPQLDDTVSKKSFRRLRDIARASGRARDIEVMIALLNHRSEPWPDDAAFEAGSLTEGLRADATTHQGKLRELVDEIWPRVCRDLAKQLSRFEIEVKPGEEWTEPPWAVIWREAAEHAFAELITALVKARRTAGAELWHAARIAAKHARYLIESSPMETPEIAAAMRALRQLQGALGRLNDISALMVELDRRSVSAPDGDRAKAPSRALRAHLRRERSARLAEARAVVSEAMPILRALHRTLRTG